VESGAEREDERVRLDVLELFDAGDVTRLVAKLAKHLTNGDLRAVHEDRANRRTKGADGLQKRHALFTVEARIDHHEVEILETTLVDRATRVDGRTHVDALLFDEVGRHGDVTGV